MTTYNARQAAVWDVINEGGEGYRPDCAVRPARQVVKTASAPSRMLRDASGAYIPEAKVRARLAANEAKLVTLTNAYAIEITAAAVAADRALLGA